MRGSTASFRQPMRSYVGVQGRRAVLPRASRAVAVAGPAAAFWVTEPRGGDRHTPLGRPLTGKFDGSWRARQGRQWAPPAAAGRTAQTVHNQSARKKGKGQGSFSCVHATVGERHHCMEGRQVGRCRMHCGSTLLRAATFGGHKARHHDGAAQSSSAHIQPPSRPVRTSLKVAWSRKNSRCRGRASGLMSAQVNAGNPMKCQNRYQAGD